MRLLPSRESAFVRVPFSENHGIAGDALTDVLPIPVDKGQFPLLVTILPVTKGIPDSAFLEELSISTVSLWKNEGSLTVSITNLSGDSEETVSILVDGNEINMGEAITLSAGIHKVRVTSTHAPTVEKTIAVEPGAAIAMLPDDIHSVEIKGDRIIRHLHFYGRPLETLDKRLTFDIANGTCKIMRMAVKTKV